MSMQYALTKSQLDKLELFHRNTIRSIQGLPDRTSSAITCLLLGSMSLEGTLDTHMLMLFVGQWRVTLFSTTCHYVNWSWKTSPQNFGSFILLGSVLHHSTGTHWWREQSSHIGSELRLKMQEPNLPCGTSEWISCSRERSIQYMGAWATPETPLEHYQGQAFDGILYSAIKPCNIQQLCGPHE